MMEVSGSSMASARVNAPNELPLLENRPTMPQAPAVPQRQGEAIPGVSVQISSAARELSARDQLSASPDSTVQVQNNPGLPVAGTPSAAFATPAATRAAGAESADRSVRDPVSSDSQSMQVRQAMQMFAETAGIGMNQQSESPLRTSA